MELTVSQYKHFYVNVKLEQQANLTFVKSQQLQTVLSPL